MFKKNIFYVLCFIQSLLIPTIDAQVSCNITVTTIDYGAVIMPQPISGICKPQNTLNIGLTYSEDMSDFIKINGQTFAATGSPQSIQIVGTPDEIMVELVGTTCYTNEYTSLDDLPTAPKIMEGDTIFCTGENIPRMVLSGQPNTPFYWTNRDGTCIQSLSFSGAHNEEWTHPHIGNFMVYQYIDGKITEPLYINIREGLPVEIIGELSFCQGESSTLHALVNGQNMTSEYDIIWHTPIGSFSDVSSITADIEYLYAVEVIDNNGCLGTASVLVEQINTPQLKIITPQSSIFNNDLRVVASGSACSIGCDYMWQMPNGTMLNTQIIETPDTGIYKLTITGKYGCAISKDITVE